MTFTLEFVSRKTARKALGALLKEALEGGLAQTVYDHAPADFATSPMVCVRSAPAHRKSMGIGPTAKCDSQFNLEILIYVVAGGKETGWKPADAQDVFDDLEAAVAQIIIRNRVNAAWVSLTLPPDQDTEIYHLSAPATGGLPYDLEIVTVKVQAYDT